MPFNSESRITENRLLTDIKRLYVELLYKKTHGWIKRCVQKYNTHIIIDKQFDHETYTLVVFQINANK